VFEVAPSTISGAFSQAEDMATPCQFNVGDRVALRGSSGIPNSLMSGVIEKVDFLGHPAAAPNTASMSCVVRTANCSPPGKVN